VKLLFDENLSPHLVERLADVYPESRHVSGVDLGGAQDSAVWEYAKLHGFAIVSQGRGFRGAQCIGERAAEGHLDSVG
jgi:predicted nuclease of predicted toxin-antitoxin system